MVISLPDLHWESNKPRLCHTFLSENRSFTKQILKCIQYEGSGLFLHGAWIQAIDHHVKDNSESVKLVIGLNDSFSP